MDRDEARAVLATYMESRRHMSYDALVALLGSPQVETHQSASGTEYTIELEARWDGETGGDVRVIACIDDGGFWSAVAPLCDDFIMRSNGDFIGE